jgi:hypothetical protein
MIDCITIDDVEYLKSDFNTVCWTSEHYFLLYALALPILMVWVIGYPIMVFVLLRKNRSKFDEKTTIATYGFFYIGLTDKSYYW